MPHDTELLLRLSHRVGSTQKQADRFESVGNYAAAADSLREAAQLCRDAATEASKDLFRKRFACSATELEQRAAKLQTPLFKQPDVAHTSPSVPPLPQVHRPGSVSHSETSETLQQLVAMTATRALAAREPVSGFDFRHAPLGECLNYAERLVRDAMGERGNNLNGAILQVLEAAELLCWWAQGGRWPAQGGMREDMRRQGQRCWEALHDAMGTGQLPDVDLE